MTGGPRDGDRAARLAEALRENLRRRKAQGRARAATAREDGAGAGPEAGDDAPHPDAPADTKNTAGDGT